MSSLYKKNIYFCALMMSTVCISCAKVDSQDVLSNHTAFNTAIQLSVSHEVLVNIVRSRYSDPMQFITVSAINAQISTEIGGNIDVGGIGSAGAVGTLNANVGYSNSPTITFTPLSDAGFYKSFYEPFEVTETIGFGLSYRFARMEKEWQILSMRLAFASINGASDFTNGQRAELYEQRIAALEYLIDHGATLLQIPEWDYDTISIAKEYVSAEDYLEAFKLGFSYIEDGDGSTVRLARHRLVLVLSLLQPEDPEIASSLEILGLLPGEKEYVFRPPSHALPGKTLQNSIWVTPRSMADVINFSTQFVEVPEDHRNIVLSIAPGSGDSSTTPQIFIRSSKDEPHFPYRIQHRNYWFYIDDRDIESKIFFESIVAAYSSRLGSKKTGDEKPQIVLPLGN